MTAKKSLIIPLALILLMATFQFIPPKEVSAQTELTKTLITRYDSSIPLDVYKAWGVGWLVFYVGFSPGLDLAHKISQVHSYGMKAVVYVTALKEPNRGPYWNGYEWVTPSQSWAQYVPATGRYLYPDPYANEYWFSPYGPYLVEVTVKRVEWVLEQGADGVFLDTLILFGPPDYTNPSSSAYHNPNYCADLNPDYAKPVWESQYRSLSLQDFRYQSLVDAARRIYSALKAKNPNAVLIISDNNVCVQPSDGERITRDKFASAIDKWQSYADAFVLEYIGLIEENWSPWLEEANAIINIWDRERIYYKVTKPMWQVAFTNRTDVFQYMWSKSLEKDVGYWTWEKFLASIEPPIILPGSHLASNPLGRVFFIFNGYKYYVTNPEAFNSYGFKWADVKPYTQVNPDTYPSAQINFDYLLDGKMPLPYKPYIAGDVNDGSLYWIPYYTWGGEKYPIRDMNAFKAYGFTASMIRFGDPAINLPTSQYILDGVNPLPNPPTPSYKIGTNPLGRVYLIFNGYKYYFTNPEAYLGYGFKWSDIDPTVNPDAYPSAQINYNYLLEDLSSILRKPLPNRPYIVGDVNDGSLYWVPYYTWSGEKYPIRDMNAFKAYGFTASMIRFGDPAINLPPSNYILDGKNPLPQIIG
jgi:hypothetical protein